jgi:hypothetical protein
LVDALGKVKDVVGKLNELVVHYVEILVLDMKPTLFYVFGLYEDSNPILIPASINVLELLSVNAVKTSYEPDIN